MFVIMLKPKHHYRYDKSAANREICDTLYILPNYLSESDLCIYRAKYHRAITL